MNNTLRHWREAATLILAAGTQHGNIVLKMANQGAQKGVPKKSMFDYSVLLLKRSQNSGFMPNAFVFPGGTVEFSDFSNDWMKVFERHIQKPNFGLGVVKQPPGTRPPMFVTDRTQFGSLIPGDVGFRICAIRETFEESGILLVVPEGSGLDANQNFMHAYEQNEEKITKWREEVQNNPLMFIEMCRELRCVPNIWALHEWGNWLTPVMSNKGRRFDTAFYICCLPKKPTTADDQKEVTSFKWWTPQEAIDEYLSQRSFIAAPQFYELCRLCHFNSIEELHRFSSNRALEGCERWMPVRLDADDGLIHTMPGDDLYPECPDITGESEQKYCINKTIQDLIQGEGQLHRIVFLKEGPRYFINTVPKYKHVHPLIPDVQFNLYPKSKL
ncbi:acyl-coenzyme A diphosphatase NUDT19-like [Gastrophryne carolinensis]